MAWREASVVVSRERATAVAAALFAAGASGTQEDWLPGEAPPPQQPWDTGPSPALPARVVVRAWFEQADEVDVGAGLAALLAADPLAHKVAWTDVVEVDWEAEWRARFPRRQVSPRITIAPPWLAEPGDIVIEPGQGFGTGDHATTRLALAALDGCAAVARSVLDVGCGSGILAIAAARLGCTARGIDIDPDAIADAVGNAARNDVQVAFDTTDLAQVPGIWDIVVANVHAEVLVTMARDLIAKTGATLVLGGILADREPLVRAAFDGHLTLAQRTSEEDWVGLVYSVRP